MAGEVEQIKCAHLLDSIPCKEQRRPEWVIELGDNRLVVLCDLCAGKASMDVVKELVRELRPQLPTLSLGKREEQ